jgi:hypothetical protein
MVQFNLFASVPWDKIGINHWYTVYSLIDSVKVRTNHFVVVSMAQILQIH